jgi:hypothetical protein
MDLAYGKPLLKTEFEVYHVVIFVHHPTPCVFFFRIDIYVCYCFGTEQTVSWCYEWVITNDRVDFSCYWAGVVNFVVFVFGSTQYSGRLRCLSAYDYLVSSSSYTWDAITGTCLGGEGRLKGWWCHVFRNKKRVVRRCGDFFYLITLDGSVTCLCDDNVVFRYYKWAIE